MDEMRGRALIAKGAEAELVRIQDWYVSDTLMKHRIPKMYRIASLDSQIREQRTRSEAEIIHKAKVLGVTCPMIYQVDRESTSLYIEYVRGSILRMVLESLASEQRDRTFRSIGMMIAKLHEGGIVHGDLTTSNLVLKPSGNVCLIDFGLSEHSLEIEKHGVDIHLLKHMLISTHYRLADSCFSSFIEGYSVVRGEDCVRAVLAKLQEIEKRGRYVGERETSSDDN